jgi:multidrug efflux pump subunit AcrB
MDKTSRLGLSGSLARIFLESEITPLLALVGMLLGLFAVLVTPREEEPQIDVTFANVFIAYPGASAKEVEHLITVPAEQILSEIDKVEHIYSVSQPGMSVLTVQFKVGEKRTPAIVNLYNALYSNQDWLPQNLGAMQPLIKPKGIDDVPIVTGTLWSEDFTVGAHELARIAHAMETELKRVPGTRGIYTIGAPEQIVSIRLDVHKLSGYKIAPDDLRRALSSANASYDAGATVNNNKVVLVQAGVFLSAPEDVADLIVGVHNGAPVYLRDVAEIKFGPATPKQYVQFGTGPAAAQKNIHVSGRFPAVTLAVAKKPGTNAADVANEVIERFEQMRGIFVPDNVNAIVTRNYGQTASDKANTLINKLIFATLSVILLVLFTLGRREALIVGAAVVITLFITLFASMVWGFTLNRVSLFALIFSIGILVDDAIVVVENIHRHIQFGGKTLRESIPLAVDEVGGPTILATFTVIAALLPMAFVSGLMGPYMSPIPINASMGMLISLLVAFIFTPWLSLKLLNKQQQHENSKSEEKLLNIFQRLLSPFLKAEGGHKNRRNLLLAVLVLIVLSIGLVLIKLVVLKMLPFDNKSEFQVIVDMPEGSALEHTNRVLNLLGDYIGTVPEVTDYQLNAGIASPINFNGLVRQYYLRNQPNQGDIQVNLVDKQQRKRQSHEIAGALREPLQEIGKPFKANIKIVEVPPGPPVLAPLVAEIYGLDYQGQIEVTRIVRGLFETTPDVVDIDDTIEAPQRKITIAVDRSRAARLGIDQQTVTAEIAMALNGEDAGYLHSETSKYPISLRLELAPGDTADINTVSALRVRAATGELVSIGEIAEVTVGLREQSIYHKDLLPVMYVFGDAAGELDSPLYGMFSIANKIRQLPVSGDTNRFNGGIEQHYISQPANPYQWSMKWDGEWQITYETFRDMGIAYSVGLILIYLLVVAQFRSYIVPLIIMAPIPLTLIGVMPGHALLDKQFTATSMIGMIALAGIIVRNSILLVDFIQQAMREGMALRDAVIESAAVRARPIVLTGLAAMLGAFFILDDPIFSGLAVSLIFGIFVSTLLTLVLIPVLYFIYAHAQQERLSP